MRFWCWQVCWGPMPALVRVHATASVSSNGGKEGALNKLKCVYAMCDFSHTIIRRKLYTEVTGTGNLYHCLQHTHHIHVSANKKRYKYIFCNSTKDVMVWGVLHFLLVSCTACDFLFLERRKCACVRVFLQYEIKLRAILWLYSCWNLMKAHYIWYYLYVDTYLSVYSHFNVKKEWLKWRIKNGQIHWRKKWHICQHFFKELLKANVWIGQKLW